MIPTYAARECVKPPTPSAVGFTAVGRRVTARFAHVQLSMVPLIVHTYICIVFFLLKDWYLVQKDGKRVQRVESYANDEGFTALGRREGQLTSVVHGGLTEFQLCV